MIVKATVTRGGFIKGVEYDLPIDEAKALIIQGFMTFVAVAPYKQREKAIKPQYETRNERHGSI